MDSEKFQSANIIDVLKKSTTRRPEVTEVVKEAAKVITKPENFVENVEKIVENGGAPVKTEPVQTTPIPAEIEDDYDYEKSAKALIDLLDTTQKSIFIFFGARRIKKKIPDKLMEEFISLDIKELSGGELTEPEKKKLQRYKDYCHRIDRLAADVPFTKEEREELAECTTEFAKAGKIKIPPGVWFGAQVMSIVSKRVINIAMS